MSLIFLVFSSIRANENSDTHWIMGVVFSLLGIITCLIILPINLITFYKWKKGINKFIASLDTKKETITCTPSAITFSNASETSVTKWEIIKQVKIFSQYISLYAGQDYHILPSVSMRQPEYTALSDYLLKKMGGETIQNEPNAA